MTISQLAFIRTIPVIGSRLYDSLKSVQDQVSNLETQTNTNAQAQPTAPPAINGVHVSTGPGGEFQIAITDQNQISRGINYWAEHDSDPNFSKPAHHRHGPVPEPFRLPRCSGASLACILILPCKPQFGCPVPWFRSTAASGDGWGSGASRAVTGRRNGSASARAPRAGACSATRSNLRIRLDSTGSAEKSINYRKAR